MADCKSQDCSFRVGDVVVVNKRDVGEIVYLDTENCSAEVEIERYDYTTSYMYPFSSLEHLCERVGRSN